jgi:hypothetical protein
MGVTARALGRFVRQRRAPAEGAARGALPVDDTSAAPAGVEHETPVAAATAALLRSTAEYVWAEARNERSGSPWTFQSQWLQDRSQSDPRRGNVGAVETGQFEVIAQTRALMMFNANVALS